MAGATITLKKVQVAGQEYDSAADVTDADKELRVYPARWPRWSQLDADGKASYLVTATKRLELLNFRMIDAAEQAQFDTDMTEACSLLASAFLINTAAHQVNVQRDPSVSYEKAGDVARSYFHSNSVELTADRTLATVDPDAWAFITPWLAVDAAGVSTYSTGRSDQNDWYYQDWGVGYRSSIGGSYPAGRPPGRRTGVN